MLKRKAREVFKEMVNLCYEEDFPELHKEIISLESVTKRNKEPYKYEKAMQELLNIIPIFTDDFPQDVMSQVEELYEEYLESRF